MPVLDKFIQAMFDQSASQLRLQSGAPAAMDLPLIYLVCFGVGELPLTGGELTSW